jgi:hypothetical protein
MACNELAGQTLSYAVVSFAVTGQAKKRKSVADFADPCSFDIGCRSSFSFAELAPKSPRA